MTQTTNPTAPARAQRNRQRGVALLITLTWIALMVALVSEFTYGTSVDAAQAANARDELRAHYMAESSVNLARLLIKIQQRFVEPVMGQLQQMLNTFAQGQSGANGQQQGQQGGAGSLLGGLGISLRVTDYAGTLMGFFSGSKEEVQALGSLIGIDTTGIKGLGMKSGRFDAEITSEDGKINVNCGSGIASDKGKQITVYRLLTALMFSPRYERLFSEADESGQFTTRPEVARALIDWADGDEQMFSVDGSASSGEDYRYDAQKDRYRAHDSSFDTLEEIKLVRGVSDGFVEAFQSFLTVYPGNPDCKVNLGAISNKTGGDCTPVLMAVIRAAAVPDLAKPPTDAAVLDDRRLYPVASVLCDRASAAGFDSLNTIISVLQSPQNAVLQDDPRYKILQGMAPLNVNAGDLGKFAYVGPTRIYRIVATGEAGKVKKKITAIIDTQRSPENYLSLNLASEKANGVLQYWREE